MKDFPYSNARLEAASESWFMLVGYGMAAAFGAGIGAIVGALCWPSATLVLALIAGALGAGVMHWRLGR